MRSPPGGDGLIYYRRVAEQYGLDVRPSEEVVDVAQEGDGSFRVEVRRPHDELKPTTPARSSSPRGTTTIPTTFASPARTSRTWSTTSPKGHPYWRRRVVVIGAGNSSVDAALECWRAGAIVTLVHFGEGFDRTVKAWVLPDITNRVKEGTIAARWRKPGPRHHADPGRDRVTRRAERWSAYPPTPSSR